MKNTINDGGFAFPLKEPLGSDATGMTLRDYFAAKALQGVEMPLSALHDTDAAYARVATHCYRMADAMLAARNGA